MSLAVWLAFLAAAIVIAITPGPGAVMSMSSGLRYGYRTAVIAICGLQAALLIQLCIVAIGFGALLAASEKAFFLAKLVGAAYLVWLGIEKWRMPLRPADQAVPAEANRGLFWQGLMVNLTNPKAIIFIGALVPQFVDPDMPQLQQYLLIGGTLCLTDMTVMSAYALAASRFGRWLHDPAALRLQNRIFGGLFVSAGALLAVSSRNA